jgi:penicillin-binding protein 1B
MATPPAARPRLPYAYRPSGHHPRRFWRKTLIVAAVLLVLGMVLTGYFWTKYARLIDQRLGGEQRAIPRIFGRAFELRPGQGLKIAQLEQRLNDVGYASRTSVTKPGEFSVGSGVVMLRTRAAASPTIRVEFSKGATTVISKLVNQDTGKPIPLVTLEAPMLTAIATGEKRRYSPLATIPDHVRQAVLAVEDHRFYDHPGVDVIGSAGAVFTNLFGDKEYLVGGSTVTQQIIKNTFLTPQKTLRRKLQEQFMALVLESRFNKDQILELYLNDVTLGQRGPFEIHGVAEAARIFFGKDVKNLTLPEAATIAGLIQSPSRLSPFRNPQRAVERRNVVLGTMVDAGYIKPAEAAAARLAPLGVATRALENEAPYFVDYVSQLVNEQYVGLLGKGAAVDVYTTIDLQLQRVAQEAVADGIALVDKQLAARKRKGVPQAALVAVDPRTGEILAMVGGRAYSTSQYNRAVTTRRQPGSVFKPFVYLSAFERMVAEGASEPTPATLVTDEPTIFMDGEKPYEPGNYQNEYDGLVSLRRALAKSRNIVAIKVAELTGYDQVAALWTKIGVGTPAKPYPSIALGVFEASPVEIASAFTLFSNGGTMRPLQALTKIVENGQTKQVTPGPSRAIARADTTYLVTNMMRAVMNEGTGAGARSAGFRLDAAGKSGTTNDLRDAWFVGFTPELLTVVWVGFDDNQPIGLGGSQAALPIWTGFMKNALAGRANRGFAVPPGVVFAEIDPETGQLGGPLCPKVITEAFLEGTDPAVQCERHQGHGGR